MLHTTTPNDKYCVTKDRSARKDARSSGTAAKIELEEIKAAHEAYTASLKSGHGESIESLHVEYEKEIAALKDQYEQTITELQSSLAAEQQRNGSQQDAVSAATSQQEQLEREASDLRRRVQLLEKGERADQRRLEEMARTSMSFGEKANARIARSEASAASGRQDEKRLGARLEALKVTHAKEVRELQRQLKTGAKVSNHWVRLSLRSKGRYKQRVYYRRCHETLTQALAECDVHAGEEYVFRRQGPEGKVCDLESTLQQLDSSDSEDIWFEKKTKAQKLLERVQSS